MPTGLSSFPVESGRSTQAQWGHKPFPLLGALTRQSHQLVGFQLEVSREGAQREGHGEHGGTSECGLGTRMVTRPVVSKYQVRMKKVGCQGRCELKTRV